MMLFFAVERPRPQVRRSEALLQILPFGVCGGFKTRAQLFDSLTLKRQSLLPSLRVALTGMLWNSLQLTGEHWHIISSASDEINTWSLREQME